MNMLLGSRANQTKGAVIGITERTGGSRVKTFRGIKITGMINKTPG